VLFDNVTMDEAVDFIDRKILEGGFHQVATANVDFVMHAIRDKGLQDILCGCDLVVPDGMPIIWAARMMGTHLKERVAGVDLVPRLADLAARRGYGIYLLGASDRNSELAADHLREMYPGLRIVGRHSPPVGSLEEMDHEEILRRIERAEPEILLVALGNPKQEKWLAMHRDRLRVPVCVGVGGTLDFLSGAARRAPGWMRSSGLEWLFRTCQEPRRLALRYLNDAAGLAMHLPPQMALAVTQKRDILRSGIHSHDAGQCCVISIRGSLSGKVLLRFDQFVRDALQSGRHIVLDMAETTHLGLDSVGSLLHLATLMKQGHRELWIAEMRPHILRVLRTARVDSYFDYTSSVGDALYRVVKADYRLLTESHSVSPTASTSSSHASRTYGVHIKVELLQNVCEKILEGIPASPANLRASAKSLDTH
jgi:N-acetylglucosaminyldiphosphoundecaprenol N-acetyl-beta-D-mannosaminyltransferase